jgi:LytS/YehU family sensor histidine kinase
VFFLLGRAWLPDNPFPAWVAATSESSLTSFRAGLMSDLSRHQMTFACFLVVKHTWYFRRRYRRQVAHTAALGAELATAQLRALHMQLHPHFVFNTLHSLSELIHENPPAAERMAQRLADLLRTAFDGRGQQLVTLDRELAFVDSYLGIQKIRFQDRLVTELDVSPDVRSWLVPNLLLQPLVENAIKHGIAQRLEGGVVRVRCAKEQGKLRIEVTDEGSPRRDPSPDAGRRTGLGLRNTESRLRRLYGQGCDLRLEWNEKGGATASVEIPALSLPARPTPRS